ncbi:hypothetical protein LCGC14_1865440, partial [marine sediment metagenome]
MTTLQTKSNLNLMTLINFPEIKNLSESEGLINNCNLLSKKSLLITGWVLVQVKEKELFKEAGFNIFTDYLESERCGFSKSQAYNYIKIYKTYKYINVQTLDKIGLSK